MSLGRATSLAIETPEGVVFSYDLASPVTRALAWLVDATVILAITQGTDRLCEWMGKVNQDWATALAVLLYFVVSIGYGIASSGAGTGRRWASAWWACGWWTRKACDCSFRRWCCGI